nr:hypothetical protein [Tanacetum cinerariifolium]
MSKSKEPNDEVRDKHNDSNTDTFSNLESASNKGHKNRFAPAEQDMVDILPVDVSTSKDSGNNKTNIDATATLGSPSEADNMKKVEGVDAYFLLINKVLNL